jgi:hypothetical protein
LTNPN